jgi:hypothetical protein
MRVALRLLHALAVLAIATAVVLPSIPTTVIGPISGWVARPLAWVSLKQVWQMYAPDPQRAQSYIELTSVERDGTLRELEETVDARNGWGTTWAWRKTRVDIWRHYAGYHPDGRNENRTWYLRAVCVREARRGVVPEKIRMGTVKRRFTPPEKVRAGAPGLGAEQRRETVTVQYCSDPVVREMIAHDRARRGGEGG